MNVKENLLIVQLLIVCIFQSKGCGQRNYRCRNRHNHRQSSNSALEFIKLLNYHLPSNLRCSILEIRKYLDNCQKKTLKRINILCRDKPTEIKYNFKCVQWYSYAFDIIDTKILKPSQADYNNKRKKCPKSNFDCDVL